MPGLQTRNCDRGRRSLAIKSCNCIRLKAGDNITNNIWVPAFHEKGPLGRQTDGSIGPNVSPEQGIVYNLGMAGRPGRVVFVSAVTILAACRLGLPPAFTIRVARTRLRPPWREGGSVLRLKGRPRMADNEPAQKYARRWQKDGADGGGQPPAIAGAEHHLVHHLHGRDRHEVVS